MSKVRKILPTPGSRTKAVLIFALVVLTAATFAGTFRNKFTGWDDKQFILDNGAMRAPALPHLATQWIYPLRALRPYCMYIPVTHTVWWTTYNLSSIGTDPDNPHPRSSWFHGLSLLLHIATGAVVFILISSWLPRASPDGRYPLWAAFFGTALFMLHPVQVQAVAWIAGARDLLFSLLGCLALLSFTRSRFKLAAVFCVAAYFSKPTAVVIPLLMLVFWWFTDQRRNRRPLVWIGVLLVAALPIVAITRRAQLTQFAPPVDLWARPFIAADALAFYAGKIAWPVRLCIEYGRSPGVVLRMPATPLIGGVFVLLMAAVWLFRRRIPVAVRFCASLFLVPLLPVLGFVPFVFQSVSTVADHYLYLPMMGLAFALAWALNHSRSRAPFISAAVVLMCLGIASFRQTALWKDDLSLFGRVVEVNPKSTAANNNLGAANFLRGNPEEAIAFWKKTLVIDPDYPFAKIAMEKFGNLAPSPSPSPEKHE